MYCGNSIFPYFRTMKMKSSICILLLLIFATSCQSPKDLEFRNVQNITLDNLSFNDATLKMELVYYNPNNYGLELNRTDFDIYVNENLLGHSLQDLQLKIPSRKEFTVPVQVNLDMKNLLKNGITALFNKEVKVRLIGKARLGKAGVYKNFNVDYTTIQNFSMFK